MSNQDLPPEERLGTMFADIPVPAPDPVARRRAIALAREAFEATRQDSSAPRHETGAKASRSWLRLMTGKPPVNGRAIMPGKQKLMYGGIATAAIAAIAVGISLQYQPAAIDPGRSAGDEMPVRDRGQSAVPVAGPLAGLTLREERESGLEDKASTEAPALSFEEAADSAALARSQPRAQVAPAPPREALAGLAAGQSGIVASGESSPDPHYRDVGRDQFQAFEQNGVMPVAEAPVSTFSADVDTASYSFARRMINSGVLPQGDAVRVEELINYFDYDYPRPETRERPFRPSVAVSDCPWAAGRKLLHIGIKGYEPAPSERPRSNLVFLLDVSGSMNSPDKLPLVKQSMELLLTTLDPDDTVAIAVYAGAAGVVLEPTPVREKHKIVDALRRLNAGGSTAGAQGIRLAYELAESRFDTGAVNRVILATDGDFNVGITNPRELQGFIERKRDQGIFLSVLGFGQGNYHDALMQALAQNGNGVAAYIDTLGEAQKVLVDEATSALFPIARDVKFQVEFNPATVTEYRLIGYETRHLNREDFNNDAVDAGDIGAGHTVTAIYEFTPVGSEARLIEARRYAPETAKPGAGGDEYAYLKIRYKLPDEDVSRLIARPITRDDTVVLGGDGIGSEAGFATAVAGFGQLLKGGRYTGSYSYDDVIALALETRGEDPYGYRAEFVQLVRRTGSAAAMQAP